MHRLRRLVVTALGAAATALVAPATFAQPAEGPTTDAPPAAPAAPPATSPSPPVVSDDRATGAAAADDDRDVQGGEHRVLGGHHFITPFGGPSPTLNTSVFLGQGFGVLTAGESTVFAYSQALSLQAGFSNRVAVAIDVNGLAAINGSLETILYLAGLAQLSVAATPKVRIVTAEDAGFQLTAGLGVGYARQLLVVPVGILQALEGAETEEELVSRLDAENIFFQAETVSVQPSVAIAEGIGPLGIQAYVAPGIAVAGSTPDGSDFTPAAELTVGAHLALDLYELGHVIPVALTAEYSPDLPLGEGTVSHTLVAGLWYSGARDFNLGGAYTAQLDEGVDFHGGILALQYFF